VLVVAFAATIPTVLGTAHGNRLVWTVGIAALPLFWIVAGYPPVAAHLPARRRRPALDRAARSATVRAAARTHVLVVPGDGFRELLAARPAMSQAVLAELVRRLRDAMSAP